MLRTLAGLGAHAASALPELERLQARRDYPAPVRAQMRATLDADPRGAARRRSPLLR